MFKKRVIMGGLPRSGSSLIRSILNGHPDILAPRETSVFVHSFADLKKKPDRFWERLSNKLDIPIEIIFSSFSRSESSIGFFDDLMKVWRRKNGRDESNIWIEKSPRNCLRYEAILKEGTEVRFISTLRDGRDVVTSKFAGHSEYYCSIERYIETVDSILKFRNTNHMIVKYEEFVASKEAELQRIMSFLELDGSPELMRLYYCQSGISEQEKVKQPVTDQWVGRWNEPEHAEIINKFYTNEDAIRCLEASGYSA